MYQPTTAQFAVDFDAYLDRNADAEPLKGLYHRFKLVNLVLMKQLKVERQVSILKIELLEAQIADIIKSYPKMANDFKRGAE